MAPTKAAGLLRLASEHSEGPAAADVGTGHEAWPPNASTVCPTAAAANRKRPWGIAARSSHWLVEYVKTCGVGRDSG